MSDVVYVVKESTLEPLDAIINHLKVGNDVDKVMGYNLFMFLLSIKLGEQVVNLNE